MGVTMRRVLATVGVSALLATVVTVQPAMVAVATAAGAFEALPAPQRLLDTRPGAVTADGQFAGIDVRAAGSTLELPVAGRAGVSSTASSVVLNVTVDAARRRWLRHRPPVRHATPQRIEPQLPHRTDDPQHRRDARRIGWNGVPVHVRRDASDRRRRGRPRARRVQRAARAAASARHTSGCGDRRWAVRRDRPAGRREHVGAAGCRPCRCVVDGVVGRVERHGRRGPRGRFRHRVPVRRATAQRVEPELRRRDHHPERRRHEDRYGRHRVPVHVRRDPPDRRRRGRVLPGLVQSARRAAAGSRFASAGNDRRRAVRGFRRAASRHDAATEGGRARRRSGRRLGRGAERHRGQCRRRRLHHGLPARHVVAQRVEPQLRGGSEHPERGHHTGRS